MCLLNALFWRGVLCSFSQIMLQNNALTGTIFIVAITINSPIMAVAALVGCCVSQLCSILLFGLWNKQSDKLGQGVYGFNGALVGLAVTCFWPVNCSFFVMLAVTATLSSLFMWLFLSGLSLNSSYLKRLEKHVYTSPFILSVWLMLLLFGSQQGVEFSLPVEAIAPLDSLWQRFMGLPDAIISAMGQVLFLTDDISGALLLFGVFVASRVAALTCCMAVALSVLIAVLLGFPETQIQSGIYSYNSVLAALVLYSRRDRRLLRFIVGVFLAVLFTRLMQLFEVTALTAPFVVSIWLLSSLPLSPVSKGLKGGGTAR